MWHRRSLFGGAAALRVCYFLCLWRCADCTRSKITFARLNICGDLICRIRESNLPVHQSVELHSRHRGSPIAYSAHQNPQRASPGAPESTFVSSLLPTRTTFRLRPPSPKPMPAAAATVRPPLRFRAGRACRKPVRMRPYCTLNGGASKEQQPSPVFHFDVSSFEPPPRGGFLELPRSRSLFPPSPSPSPSPARYGALPPPAGSPPSRHHAQTEFREAPPPHARTHAGLLWARPPLAARLLTHARGRRTLAAALTRVRTPFRQALR